MAPPFDSLYIVAIGIDLGKHELLDPHVMIIANGIIVRAVHRAEHLFRVTRHRAVYCRFKTSEVGINAKGPATGTSAKPCYASQVVICHCPVSLVLIFAPVEFH